MGLYERYCSQPKSSSEVFLESMSSTLNKQSGEAFFATLVGGTAGAVRLPQDQRVQELRLLARYHLPFAAAGSQLEIAAAFTELVQEELGDSEFNAENVYNLLNNEEKYGNIVRKSKTKGYTIGAIDVFAAKVGIGAFEALTKAGERLHHCWLPPPQKA